jgi:hypothetical protein
MTVGRVSAIYGLDNKTIAPVSHELRELTSHENLRERDVTKLEYFIVQQLVCLVSS